MSLVSAGKAPVVDPRRECVKFILKSARGFRLLKLCRYYLRNTSEWKTSYLCANVSTAMTGGPVLAWSPNPAGDGGCYADLMFKMVNGFELGQAAH